MFETDRAGQRNRPRRRLPWQHLGVLIVGLNLAPALSAQEREQVARPADHLVYPRTNLSTGYEAVANWPSRPKNFAFGAVAGIAISPSQEVWTFNRGTAPVQVYTTDGTFVRSWGQDQFREPHQVRIDREGFVWLVDSGLHVVRKYTTEGKLLLTLGSPGEPGEDSTHLNKPTDVAIAPEGHVFVSDGYGNNRIVRYDRNGQFAQTWGTLGSEPGQFSLPHSIALDSQGRIFVADRNNARVQVFDPSGRFLAEWRDLLVPWHIVITPQDEIYVCGSSPMRWPMLPIKGLVVGIPPKDQLVMVFTPDGRLTRLATFPKGQRAGEVDWVHAMAVDQGGNLYLGDIQGRRPQKFLRMEPAGRLGDLVKKSLPKRDNPVTRTSKP